MPRAARGLEMKALVDTCADVAQFPPGHYFDSASGELVRYYARGAPTLTMQGRQADLAELRQAFEHAVERQLMSDVPYGVLLSGGLDSSLVAAVAARYARRRIEDGGQTEAWWPRLHSFAIGLKGSPDLAAAAIAAEALGTVHHGFEYTFEEGLDALPEVIRHIETYDVTTIRASTPMFPAGAADQGDGGEDGALRREQRRDLWWLPVFPQGAGCA